MLVVDSGVAIKWFVLGDFRPQARDLLASREELHAPDLILVEFTNAVWKKVTRGEIQNRQGASMIGALPGLMSRLHPSGDVLTDALDIAFELRHPIYDCIYLACAMRWDGTLVTADERLLGKVANTGYGSFMEHIGNFG